MVPKNCGSKVRTDFNILSRFYLISNLLRFPNIFFVVKHFLRLTQNKLCFNLFRFFLLLPFFQELWIFLVLSHGSSYKCLFHLKFYCSIRVRQILLLDFIYYVQNVKRIKLTFRPWIFSSRYAIAIKITEVFFVLFLVSLSHVRSLEIVLD